MWPIFKKMRTKSFLKNWKLKCRIFFSLGRFVSWDVLSLRTFCPWDILSLGRFVSWDVLSLGPYVLERFVLGRFVPWDVLSWEVLSVHRLGHSLPCGGCCWNEVSGSHNTARWMLLEWSVWGTHHRAVVLLEWSVWGTHHRAVDAVRMMCLGHTQFCREWWC